MLWLATENMQDIALGILEPGMESAISLVNRGAIQRSYTVSGALCTQNIIDPSTVTLKIGDYGYYIGLLWIIGQFIVNGIAILAFFPWLFLSYPIFPAVEACNSPIIFSLLSAKNAITHYRMQSMSGNMEDALMWPRLDLVLRIGESIETAEDPDRGVILMDRPKAVTEMTFQKAYV